MAVEPESRFYSSQRSRLHYLDWGNPDGPLLILIHGGRDSCRSWDWIARALHADWHVIAPDLRGHGDSDWSADGAYPMAGFVLDIANLIEHLGEIPATIVAHSLGGNIALRYAGSYPDRVRKLVSVEGMGPSAQTLRRQLLPPGEQLRSWIEDRRALDGRQARRYVTIDEAAKRLLESSPHFTSERAAHLALHGVRINDDGTYSWKYDNYTRGFAPVDTIRPRELWRAIDCPVLHLHGAASWGIDQLSDENLSCFGDVRVAMIEGAGHWPHHDDEAAFLAAIRAFL